jgi:hypothetical protein
MYPEGAAVGSQKLEGRRKKDCDILRVLSVVVCPSNF